MARNAARASSTSSACNRCSTPPRSAAALRAKGKSSSAAAIGAQSRTMPRFALQPAAACAASMDRSMRRPTGSPWAQSGPTEARAAARKIVASMP
jgi:hypothetical protein